MGCEVLVAPHRVKAGDELATRNNTRPGGAHHLEHAGGDAVEVGNGIAGRVLHCDMLPRDQVAKLALEHAPAAVCRLFPLRRPIPPWALLDCVCDCGGPALARNEDERSTSCHSVEAKHSAGDWVESVKIEDQPAVE